MVHSLKSYWIGGMSTLIMFSLTTWLLMDNSFLTPNRGRSDVHYDMLLINSTDLIPKVVGDFLLTMKKHSLIVTDTTWLECLANEQLACEKMSSKKDFIFSTKSSLPSLDDVEKQFGDWDVQSGAHQLVFKLGGVRIFLSEAINRKTYWYLPGIEELDTPATAFHSLDTSLERKSEFDISYPKPLRAFLVNASKAEFIECNRTLARQLRREHADLYKNGSVLRESIVMDMAYLRDMMSHFLATPMLFGGTLLGWYRECGLIPHTTDVDMAVFAKEFSWPFIKKLEKDKRLRLYWLLGKVMFVWKTKIFFTLDLPCIALQGRVQDAAYSRQGFANSECAFANSLDSMPTEDSLELSVTAQGQKIDVFYLYEDAKGSWVGGMIPSSRTRLRWTYPKIPRLCTADLLGELFHVPCNVEEVLKADYGAQWSQIHHTKSFVWYNSHKNVKKLGKYTPAEWTQVYRLYRN